MSSRIVLRFALTLGLALVLESCLVHTDKTLKTYPIRQQVMRIIQGGEHMEYVVTGFRLLPTLQSENIHGSMTVDWQLDSIFNPTTSLSMNVLKATTNLDILGTETATVQYFTQSPVDAVDAGSLYLVATQGASKDDLYWVETDASHITPEPVKVLWSPLDPNDATLHPYAFDIISSCNAGGCDKLNGSLVLNGNQIERTPDNQVVIEKIETQYGNFYTYRVGYSGTLYSAETLTASVDPRLSCAVGAQGYSKIDPSFYNINPDIGIVRMVNTCVVAGITLELNATLRDSNIVLTPDNP